MAGEIAAEPLQRNAVVVAIFEDQPIEPQKQPAVQPSEGGDTDQEEDSGEPEIGRAEVRGWKGAQHQGDASAHQQKAAPEHAAQPHPNQLVSFRTTVRVTRSTVAWYGGAEAAWLGRTPFNATRVSMSETYRVMGMHVSVPHLRVPGFGANGNAVTWSASAPGTWGLYHRVNGCPVFVTHGPVWSASEQADTEIQVGSAFYSIDTMSSAPLRTSGL